MTTLVRLFLGLLAVSATVASSAAAEPAPAAAPGKTDRTTTTPPPAPTTVDDFALLDHLGRHHLLSTMADVPVVVLYVWQTGCPIARQDSAVLTTLAGTFAGGARILLLDPAPGDDRAVVAAEAKELASPLPVLLDPAQIVARDLAVTRTGEAIVISTKDWRIAWRGPVDDRLGYGTQKPVAGRAWLNDAITAVIAGKALPADAPAAKGCRITFADLPVPDYATTIAPLLLTHCTGCHTTGGVAPFSFANYDKTHGRAAMVKEVLRTRRMPPWGADAPSGTFADDNVLSTAETAQLVRWIDAGAPRGGSGADPLTKARPAPAEWPLGKPDLIVDCPPQQIPATGTLPYRNVVVPVDLPADTWVRAYDLRPSERRAMHHAFAFAVPPGVKPKPGDPRFTGLDDFLADYVPGLGPISFPADTGKPLGKGSLIAFQLHYTTFGTACTDRPRLGLYLTRKKPAHEVRVASAKDMDFTIPPNVREVPGQGTWRAPQAISLIGMSPHLHLRGARMSYSAKLPDGSVRQLLSVPRYDLNWQALYRPATPIALPAGTLITCDGAWDNSKWNEANPDPSKTVRWGVQSWDEMFLGYIIYSVP